MRLVQHLAVDEGLARQLGDPHIGEGRACFVGHDAVGFEVDEIDTATRTGWSVLGIGQAYEILDPARLDDLAVRAPDPWAPGHDAHTISIPLQRLTGRRLILR
jgi:hypothetical protein